MKVYLNDEKKICRPTASFKEGWTVLTGTIVLFINMRFGEIFRQAFA